MSSIADSSHGPKATVRIVGGGFSGLVAAYRLVKAGFERVEIYDSKESTGGMITTERLEGCGIVESAANALLNSWQVQGLAKEIGLELLPTLPTSRKRWIYQDGKALRWPLSVFETLGTLRRFVFARGGRAPHEGETVRQWGLRVLGSATTENLLIPALAGVFGDRSGDLSASLTVGRWRMFRKTAKIPKDQRVQKGSRAPREGMGELISKLTEYLENNGVKFKLGHALSSEQIASFASKGPVVLATSIDATSKLVERVSPDLAARLESIPTRGLVTATLFFKVDSDTPVEAFGCLFPTAADFRSLGVLFNSSIFENRGPAHSETWILPEGRELPVSEIALLDLILTERKRLYSFKAAHNPSPIKYKIRRWPKALPAYTLELEKLLRETALFEAARSSNLFFIGNWLGDLGLSSIFENSIELPSQILAHSAEAPHQRPKKKATETLGL